MDSVQCKELIIGCIRYHFDGARQKVEEAGGGSGKALSAIANAKSSLVLAASGVDARTYDDHDLSSKLLGPGVDLAYRSVIVSDVKRDDEWVAVLAVGLDKLDEHTRKVVLSWHNQAGLKRDVGETTPRRLLVFISCAKKLVTMNPVFSIASETAGKSLVLSPCVFQWPISLFNGQSKVIGYVELTQELLDWAGRMLSVIDSSHSARLFNDHVRGADLGTMQ